MARAASPPPEQSTASHVGVHEIGLHLLVATGLWVAASVMMHQSVCGRRTSSLVASAVMPVH